MNGIKDYYLKSLSRTKNETHARLNTQRKILAVMNAAYTGFERSVGCEGRSGYHWT